MTGQPEALLLAADLEMRPASYTRDMQIARLLREQHEEIERLRADAERWKDLATDAVSGLRYIRQGHGDLTGVGWDRVLAKEAAIDAAMQERGMARPVERTGGQQTARSKP